MTGKQFGKLRKELGYTQATLAKRFGCSSRTVRNFQLEKQVKGIVELAMTALRMEQQEKESKK